MTVLKNSAPFVAVVQPLSWKVPITSPSGTPTQEFQRQWQNLINNASAQSGMGNISILTGAALVGGLFVTINSGGQVIPADATDATKPAVGFVTTSFGGGSQATIYLPGQPNGGLTGLTPGKALFLATKGGWTHTVPTSGANQFLGYAFSTTQMVFQPGPIQAL